MLSITNGLGRAYDIADTQRGTTLAWADTVLGRVVGLDGTNYGVCDKYIHADLDGGAQNFRDAFAEDTFWTTAASTLIQGLSSNANVYGRHVSTTIIDLDSYATYYNAATPFSMTYCSSFARLYWLWKAKLYMLTAANVVGPSVTLGYGTVTGTAAITFVDGAAVNTVSTVSSGTQGYCADSFYLQGLTGTLTGTVTATGINQVGGTVTWSAIASGITTGTVAFTPGTAGDRTTDITGLSYIGDGTAATFSLKTTSRDIST